MIDLDTLPPPAPRPPPPPPPPPPPVVAAGLSARTRRRLRTTVIVTSVVTAQAGLVAVLLVALALNPVPIVTLDDPAEVAAIAEDVETVAAALDLWWADAAEERQVRFTPVGDRITDGDDDMRCDGTRIIIDEDLFDNAFAAMCSEGMTVGYDPQLFGDPLTRQVILAHEWGHLFQFANPKLDVLVIRFDDAFAEGELQADCFAGAWVGVTFDEADQASAVELVGDMGYWWDVADDDPEGHGTPQERSDAMQLGIDGGVDACLPDVFDPR